MEYEHFLVQAKTADTEMHRFFALIDCDYEFAMSHYGGEDWWACEVKVSIQWKDKTFSQTFTADNLMDSRVISTALKSIEKKLLKAIGTA